jgi:DNA/RNA-binding domain of Phe-tRNA-synthetase-like protein
MSGKDYTVADAVFESFPDYVRGVVIAHGVANRPSPPELVKMLRQAEDSVRESVKPDELAANPHIASWREAFKALGMRPSDFRPSMDAMARRVLKNQQLPSISTLVDIGNVLSLRHFVPIGGHAIDVLVEGMALRPAGGQERFMAFGSSEEESPKRGEFILADGDIVLARRWIWRQAQHTLLLPTTTALAINVDCLPPLGEADVRTLCAELQAIVAHFCGGTSTLAVLSRHHRRLSLGDMADAGGE